VLAMAVLPLLALVRIRPGRATRIFSKTGGTVQ